MRTVGSTRTRSPWSRSTSRRSSGHRTRRCKCRGEMRMIMIGDKDRGKDEGMSTESLIRTRSGIRRG